MATGFLDLLTQADLQREAQQLIVKQRSQGLAVRPKLDLTRAIRQAQANHLAAEKIRERDVQLDFGKQRIGLAERELGLDARRIGLQRTGLGLDRRRLGLNTRRLGLDAQRLGMAETAFGYQQDAARYEQRLTPWAIGIGALDLGVNVLGGLQALQTQRQQASQMRALEGFRAGQLASQQQYQNQALDILRQRRYQTQGFLNPNAYGPGF